MTSFLLKIIGIISMTFDHIGIAILGRFSFLNLIGRLAFPLFAFQATEGFIHTKDFKKYILKLFVFACVSQIPFLLFSSIFSNNYFSLNVLFTFILGLSAIYLYHKSNNKFCGLLLVVFFGIVSEFINVNYGMYGIFLMFVFYIFKSKKLLIIFSSIILMSIFYMSYMFRFPDSKFIYFLYLFFSCLSIVLVCLYNKNEGPKAKYLFYIFYPLHLIVLYVISFFV